MTTLRDVQPASRVLQYDPFLRFFFSIIRRESGVAASAGGFLDMAEESGMLIRCRVSFAQQNTFMKFSIPVTLVI